VRAFISAGTISGSIIYYRLTQLVTLRMHGALPMFSLNLRGSVIKDGNNLILPLPKATVINQPEDIL
jgi:hypothetical protein